MKILPFDKKIGMVMLVILGVWAIVYLETESVYCEELRKYELPSQGTYSVTNLPKATQKVDESVYKDFGEKVKGMNPKQKKELIVNFKAKYDVACRRDQDEAQHYKRLLGILEGGK